MGRRGRGRGPAGGTSCGDLRLQGLDELLQGVRRGGERDDLGVGAIGQEVEMSFRRIYTAPLGRVHNYFWKARPVRDGGANDA